MAIRITISYSGYMAQSLAANVGLRCNNCHLLHDIAGRGLLAFFAGHRRSNNDHSPSPAPGPRRFGASNWSKISASKFFSSSSFSNDPLVKDPAVMSPPLSASLAGKPAKAVIMQPSPPTVPPHRMRTPSPHAPVILLPSLYLLLPRAPRKRCLLAGCGPHRLMLRSSSSPLSIFSCLEPLASPPSHVRRLLSHYGRLYHPEPHLHHRCTTAAHRQSSIVQSILPWVGMKKERRET